MNYTLSDILSDIFAALVVGFMLYACFDGAQYARPAPAPSVAAHYVAELENALAEMGADEDDLAAIMERVRADIKDIRQ